MRVQISPAALMTDTTTQEIDTMPVTPNFQVDSGNNQGTEPNQLTPIPSTPVNKDAPAPVPTWSEQVAALRDDFVRGENPSVLLTLVDQEVKRYFAANNQNPADIDDLCQEVQIKLFLWQRKMIQQRKDGIDYKAPDNFPGFIRGIAHNVLIDKYRRRKATFVESDLVEPGAKNTFLEQIPDTTPPIDQELDAIDARDQLQAILPQLSEQQQRILDLHLSGVSNKEIAETLHLNQNAVNVALFHLKTKIRKLLSAPPNPK